MTRRNRTLAVLLALPLALSLCCVELQAKRTTDPDKYYKSPGSLHGKTVLIPIGSHIEGRLSKTISSRKSKQGEKFSIEITSPVLANGTEVVIPVGSRIIGEVVEAIPSRKQRKIRGMPRPLGKLRTQLSVIKTPDGVSHPIVASISGEYFANQSGRLKENKDLDNPSMAYVGSHASFAAVHPGVAGRSHGRRGPKVVKRREYFRDPILGTDSRNKQRGMAVIRSMVRKKRDIYIFAGSPLKIRIDAPLKIAVMPAKGRLTSVDLGPIPPPVFKGRDGYRRFKPMGDGSPSPTNASSNAIPSAKTPKIMKAPDPEAHLPRFLRTPKTGRFLKQKSPFPGAPQGPTGGDWKPVQPQSGRGTATGGDWKPVRQQPGPTSAPGAGAGSWQPVQPTPVRFPAQSGGSAVGKDDF